MRDLVPRTLIYLHGFRGAVPPDAPRFAPRSATSRHAGVSAVGDAESVGLMDVAEVLATRENPGLWL